MIGTVSFKYACRSLVRHKRRTILSALGIGMGCAVSLLMLSFIRGEREMLTRAAANSGVGHVIIAPTSWADTRDDNLRITDWKDIRDAMSRRPQVVRVAPKSTAEGLLAFGTRIAPVALIGVDPDVEPTYNRLVKTVSQGRYLVADGRDEVVIGRKIATRLDVELEDDLMVTIARETGEMSGAMLRIVGIISTGSDEMDSTICHVNLDDLARLTGRDGVGKLTLVVKYPRNVEELCMEINKELPRTCTAITWMDVMPELAAGVEIDKTWTNLTISIITLMVFLGIASAQLTAVLERRREFAVLAALGMTSLRLIAVMIIEGVILGALGCASGLILGIPAVYYIATQGIDFTQIYGDLDLSMSNVMVEPVLYGDMGWWLLPYAVTLSLTATILSSFYPAWYALNTDPSTALRVDH